MQPVSVHLARHGRKRLIVLDSNFLQQPAQELGLVGFLRATKWPTMLHSRELQIIRALKGVGHAFTQTQVLQHSMKLLTTLTI